MMTVRNEDDFRKCERIWTLPAGKDYDGLKAPLLNPLLVTFERNDIEPLHRTRKQRHDAEPLDVTDGTAFDIQKPNETVN